MTCSAPLASCQQQSSIITVSINMSPYSRSFPAGRLAGRYTRLYYTNWEIKINRSVKINELFTLGHLSMMRISSVNDELVLQQLSEVARFSIARCTTLDAAWLMPWWPVRYVFTFRHSTRHPPPPPNHNQIMFYSSAGADRSLGDVRKLTRAPLTCIVVAISIDEPTNDQSKNVLIHHRRRTASPEERKRGVALSPAAETHINVRSRFS